MKRQKGQHKLNITNFKHAVVTIGFHFWALNDCFIYCLLSNYKFQTIKWNNFSNLPEFLMETFANTCIDWNWLQTFE